MEIGNKDNDENKVARTAKRKQQEQRCKSNNDEQATKENNHKMQQEEQLKAITTRDTVEFLLFRRLMTGRHP